ncbi:hypothetical protein KP509_17G083500 [Ceratopteris richardii]|nr:hypothetical protein KP509_17G083500 [Ceratopteris richardii]KAH7374011.1 hypothetical protein KP509_17G083500 [Ceratopteris richardii]
MLDMYDFMDDIWLCHSFGGVCYNFTAFEPAVNTLKEMSTFLAANPSEVITIFIEDYVTSPNGLTNLFKAAGLDNYLFPVSSMPKDGGDWMTLTEMVSKNYRLLVFTSKSAKEASEGIAYDWRYVNENQYGDAGTQPGNCSNRAESEALNTTSRSLLLMNFFPTNPVQDQACTFNSASLLDMLPVCYKAAGNRWPNFLAVDYYKRSDGGGVFSALDAINGGLICGCPEITSCKSNSSFGVCSNATTPPTTTTGNFSGNLNSIPPSAPVDERSTGFRIPSFHFQFILFQASIILVFHWTFS